MLEIKDFDSLKERMKQGYRIQYLELRTKENLLQLCEQIDGSLIEEGMVNIRSLVQEVRLKGKYDFYRKKCISCRLKWRRR